jgi:ATP adenylyltransferase
VAEKSGGCIFCDAAASRDGEDSLVVFRGERVFVILNRYPYTNGHLMVAPYAHEGWLSSSNAQTLTELIETVARAEKILVAAYRTDGLNVGINFGSAAGAGVAEHYHVHIVPRWNGDTNFMTVTAGTRVVPEELAVTLARLKPLFARSNR